MNHLALPAGIVASVAFLAPSLCAQIQLSVSAASESGIAVDLSGAPRIVRTFPAAHAFTSTGRLNILHGQPVPLFPGFASIDHSVSPPTNPPLPPPFTHLGDRVQVSTGVRASDGALPTSLHTTGNSAGDPGTQRYDVKLTAAGNTQALVTLRLSLDVWDNASASLLVTGGGINRTLAASTPGSLRDVHQATVAVNGAATLRVEVTGVTTPGSGPSWWDGFVASVAVETYDLGRAGFATFGNGCGTGTIAGSGTPIAGTDYRVNLDGAPANATAMLITGSSRTNFHFLPLPLPLAYMGAPGCDLNVAPMVLLPATANGSGHAELELFLSRFLVSPTLYVQWVVVDPGANAAGITTTQGAEIRW